jgi:hypothetical protein
MKAGRCDLHVIEYKLLDNQKGVILTRQPLIAEDELYFSFEGALHDDATAIFEIKNGDCYYRSLSNGRCSLSLSNICGEVKVTVALLNGETPPRRWLCEEFKADKQRNGGTLISPNDMNLPQTVVALQLENQEIRQSFTKMEKQYDELRTTLEKIMEGYDFT